MPTDYIHLPGELAAEIALESFAAKEPGDQPELEHVVSEVGDHIDTRAPVGVRPSMLLLRIEHVRVIGIKQVSGKIIVVNTAAAETG